MPQTARPQVVHPSSKRGSTTEPAVLAAALDEIQNQPRYQPSDWGYSVLDQKTGEVLAAHNADHLFDPGSTMKTYSVSTALRLYGSDYRFRTPVYRVGNIVRNSGITRVNGDVVIDDRLFTPCNGFPDGLIQPIWVNENLIDALVTPGTAAGQPHHEGQLQPGR
jgi:D-alanyl-D-alanine carboxypeptidase